MTCIHCGNSVPEDSDFCPYCGKKIEPPAPLQPEEPAAPILEGEADAPRKKSRLPVLILSALAVILLGMNIFQFYTNYRLSASNTRLETQLSAINESPQLDQLSALEAEIDALKTALSAAESTTSAKTDRIHELTTEKYQYIRELTDLQNAFDLIRDSRVGYASENFHLNTGVVVLSSNDAPHRITLTAHWDKGGTVRYSNTNMPVAYVSIDNDEWYTSTPVTISPLSKGVNIVTFSNSADSDTFKLLIIVTD